MAILVKVIKPRRFEARRIVEEVLAAQRDIARRVKADYEKTTATWKHKPKFEVLSDIDVQGNVTVLVGTDNERYGWIDEGTKKRDIKPRKPGGVLVFPSGYSPATEPGHIGSYPAGSYGSTVFTTIVRDHEIKARKFTSAITKKWAPKYRRAMERALVRGAKRAWVS